MMSLWVTVIVLTLIGVALGRLPWVRMNRATIAMVGATLIVALGALSLDEAISAIDWQTIILLFSMMVINVNLRLAGFFDLVSTYALRNANGPGMLLAGIVISSGFFSALFLNDTIAIVMTPLVIEVTVRLKRHPTPYLIGLVAAANIGSVATITGNPQNMLIGVSSEIPYLRFLAVMAPLACAGLFIVWFVVRLIYRSEFSRECATESICVEPRIHLPLLIKSVSATVLLLVGFVFGVPIPLAAALAASVVLVTRRLKPERVFHEVDWGLLVFFAGLFVVTGALEKIGLGTALLRNLDQSNAQSIASLTATAAILSNIVSNVPAVLLIRPLIPDFADPEAAWMTLAMATTFAGNLTLLGSVANLIVAETARRHGIQITFSTYLKAGIPITLLSLAIGVLYLASVTANRIPNAF